VNARIEMIDGFSGHADKEGLLSWLGAFGKKPGKIILVHGEDEIINKFSESIKERFGIPTEIPSQGSSITLGAPVAERAAMPAVFGRGGRQQPQTRSGGYARFLPFGIRKQAG